MAPPPTIGLDIGVCSGWDMVQAIGEKWQYLKYNN